MSRYLAINIGPIIKTFSMARKPKEFWAASYMFSYLMECILETLHDIKGIRLISPFYKKDSFKDVGLFPDRAFYEIDDNVDIDVLIENAVDGFAKHIDIEKKVVSSFFQVMTVCKEYGSSSEAILDLNKKLDILEMNRNAWNSDDFDHIFKYLHNTNKNSQLFNIAFGKNYFPIETLEEIALAGEKYPKYSYNKYVCIVQADGDNMGKVVSSAEMEGRLNEFSSELMTFGESACKKIKEFKGLPIYAGGDDLLFIAPVVYNGRTILDLVNEIDILYKKVQEKVDEIGPKCTNKNNEKDAVHTSLSYGISIIYHKYPLYEAWDMARNELFAKAKNVDRKNAVAIKLRKNSGSDFQMQLSKSAPAYKGLQELIKVTDKESLVSAVAHKLRSNVPLLSIFPREEPFNGLNDRLDAFFEKVLDLETKSENESEYLKKTEEIFEMIYRDYFTSGKDHDKDNAEETLPAGAEIDHDLGIIVSRFYSMLRIAKFMKGEEVKNE